MEQLQALALIALVAFAGLISVAEIVVRFTPTKSDDGAVKRIGDRIDKLLDLLKVPNRKAEPPAPKADKSE